MSFCQATVELSNYLDKQEKALENFTSCLPEYRDKVANEVIELFYGNKSDEEFQDVFKNCENHIESIEDVLDYYKDHCHNLLDKGDELLLRIITNIAIEYYCDVLYNSSIEEMLDDNDGTTLEDWIDSVL